MESYTVSWQAPEFEHIERSAGWYLWSMIVAGVLILVALWQKNILFALFVLIAEVMLVAFGRQAPESRVYVLHADGLFVDDQKVRLYSESSAYSFFDTGGRYVELVLRPAKKMHTYAKVLVPQERVEDVRAVLAQRLPVFEYNGTVSDTMARWLQM